MNYFNRLLFTALFCCSSLPFSFVAAQPLVERWSIKNTFNMPESAVFDPVSRQIFVSNVNHYAKDGNGFISRVSADGADVEVTWLPGLNSPTGLTVHDGRLFVVDYDELVIVNIADKQILAKVAAPHQRPALNDVTVSPSGDVFVTGSSSAAIYKLETQQLIVWKQNDELLKHANGLLIDQARLVFGGLHWAVFDLETKSLADDFVTPSPKIIEFDGITPDGCGGYIVTLIDDDRLWQITENGYSKPLSETAINGIDLSSHDGLLYVPTVGGGLSVIEIPSSICDLDS